MTWIQTYTGIRFTPAEPRLDDIDIHDIAHALSMQCRFSGHCRTFYSVAEHAVRVSRHVSPANALWGLLHDAAEAYLTDLPRPVKQVMPEFQAFEDQLLQAVAHRFGLTWPLPDEVVRADCELLATEARDLMGPPPDSWGLGVDPLPGKIVPWSAAVAEQRFLERFDELCATGRAGP